MKTLRIYFIGILIFVIIFFLTIPYRKRLRKKLNKKEHRLLIMYGMAMFIVDKSPIELVKGNKKLSRAIKELCVKENVEKENYFYFVKKVSICLIAVFLTLIIGCGMCISENISNSKKIESLERDKSKTLTYEFVAQNEEGEEETVVVNVKRRELTANETKSVLSNLKKPVVEEVLNNNVSVEYVDQPLNLISSIGEYDAKITWDISDTSVVGYDGKIGDKVPENGKVVKLTAIMTLNDVSLEYAFSINVFPKKDSTSLQKQIQKYVNENDIHNNSVKLPEIISGQSIKYYEKISKISGSIVVVGFGIAVALFFLKDRDIKKAVEKRNEQMLKDYPEIVSKILLYYGAGLSIKSVFEKITEGYKKEKAIDKKVFRYAYEELEIVLIKMKSGVSELTAIIEYGNRCGLHCYIKLANIIEQNMRRGTKELTYALRNEVDNALLERKNSVLKQGEKMSTKLLGPMILMLIISISIIVVPTFMSMGF